MEDEEQTFETFCTPQMERFCQYFIAQSEGDDEAAEMLLDDMIELDGVPESLRAAHYEAKRRGKEATNKVLDNGES